MPDEVDIRFLKEFVRQSRVPPALRFLIVQERDRLAPEEFCVKVGLWLRLFDYQGDRSDNE